MTPSLVLLDFPTPEEFSGFLSVHPPSVLTCHQAAGWSGLLRGEEGRMSMEHHGHGVGASTVEKKTAPCLGSEQLRTLKATGSPLRGDGNVAASGAHDQELRHAYVRMNFVRSDRSVPLIRTSVRRIAEAWGLDALIIDDAELVASELVPNAVRHAPCPEIGFTATYGAALLLIQVHDGSVAPPILRHGSTGSAESGRGLVLVRSLTRDWGWIPHGDGTKSTWALIDVPTTHALAPTTGTEMENHRRLQARDEHVRPSMSL
ncbi:ATP-binding protein [Streptomyces sp. NPDC058653]|uniref:ATP-binding protein n=1 Tax=Streptomyces sp. NPDC058653 TaxID=3346576 RepID=UPI00365BD50B